MQIPNSLSVFFLSLLSFNLGFALEPLKSSSDAYTLFRAERELSRSDKDKDGRIDAAEYGKSWKRHKRHDINQDGALDLDELIKIPTKYVNSSGKRLVDVLYKRTDLGDAYLDFYAPAGATSTQKPVVVYTHGGGWAAGSKQGAGQASFHVVHKALLKAGFCVVSVEYRLVSKGNGVAIRDCVIDTMDAVRYISAYKNELGIDPNQIYTFGDSAGGHLAQMLLLTPPDQLKGDPELAKYDYKTVAGVSWYGPCDFEDEQLFNHDDRENFRDRFGLRIMGSKTGPKDKLSRYREVSPVNYLTPSSPALLMIQGDQDTTIPVKQAYRMQEALKTIHAPVEILLVENAGHNWRSVDAPIQPTRNEIVQKTIDYIVSHR